MAIKNQHLIPTHHCIGDLIEALRKETFDIIADEISIKTFKSFDVTMSALIEPGLKYLGYKIEYAIFQK